MEKILAASFEAEKQSALRKFEAAQRTKLGVPNDWDKNEFLRYSYMKLTMYSCSSESMRGEGVFGEHEATEELLATSGEENMCSGVILRGT